MVPLLAVLTVIQIALVSLSKLVSISDLYRVKRFGHYSEAAATLSYCFTSFVAITLWWDGQSTTPISIDERRPVTLEWARVSLITYVILLAFLTMFLLPRNWFQWSWWRVFAMVMASFFGFGALAIISDSQWVEWLANATGFLIVAYFVAWLL